MIEIAFLKSYPDIPGVKELIQIHIYPQEIMYK